MFPNRLEAGARSRPVRSIPAGLLALLLLAAPAARAEWQNFQAGADGLADNLVLSIVEARDGALWFGTQRGASRFDGVRWSTVADSLPGLNVYDVLEDAAGREWFATIAGLARRDQDRWIRVRAEDGRLPSNTVHALLEDHRGDVWVGTAGGLVRYEPGADRWTTTLAGPTGLVNRQAWRLLEARDHSLWVATPEGVSRLDSTRTNWTSFAADPLALARDSVLAIAEDGAGRIWCGTDRGVWVYDGASWSAVPVAGAGAANVVLSLASDRRGGMWVGTASGVHHFDGRTWRSFPAPSENLSLGAVYALRLDSSGNLWTGTASAGVFRYDGVSWWHHFSPTGSCPAVVSANIPNDKSFLDSNCVSAMLRDRAGELWFGTFDGGVSRLGADARWTKYRRAAGRALSDSIRTIGADRFGNLWFGSWKSGVTRLDSTRTQWTLFHRAAGLAGDTVRAVSEDAAGDVWIGTSNGLSRWNGTALTTYRPRVALDVRQILEDPDGVLWLRTSAGLWSFDAARATLAPVAGALPYTLEAGGVATCLLLRRSGELWVGGDRGASRWDGAAWATYNRFGAPGDSSVQSLFEDRDEQVWVGTDFDAARFDGTSWTPISATDLGSPPVNGISQDSAGGMWLATFAGVARWNGDAWRIVDSRGNGLVTDLVTGFLEDGHGQVWLASNRGLAQHAPDRAAPQTVFVSKPESLSPSRNVSFVFGAAYGEAADLEFSIRWDGGPWSSWSAENAWQRTGVADGIHRFEVRARDWLRNADSTLASYTFEVDATPPAALITSLSFDQPVRGTVTLTGSTADPRFHTYQLEARPLGLGTWTGPGVLELASGIAPVEDGPLGQWNTTPLADGDWEVRLSVTDSLGLVGVSLVRVIVDNHAPFASVTTPARVNAAAGGDVYTTNAEVHLYAPPQAFDQDAVVSIERVPEGGAAATLPNGAPRVGPAWDLRWSPARLTTEAQLELASPAGSDGASLSVWAEATAGNWVPLGGTFDAARGVLALPLLDPIRVALFQTGTPEGARSLSGLILSPRVFSPRGGYATSDVGIGFTLGRPANVTVRVYNRAGRLVRLVAENRAAGAGANLLRWDGRDRDGAPVGAGLYLVTVEALGGTMTRTLAVVR